MSTFFTRLFEQDIRDEEGDPLATVTADTYEYGPIDFGIEDRGEPVILTVRDAKRIRRALKRAIKAAEAFHGKDA